MLQADARKRLRHARWEAGLSRKELSDATDKRVSESTIINIENVKDKPDYEPLPQTVFLLATALGLDGADFIAEAAS